MALTARSILLRGSEQTGDDRAGRISAIAQELCTRLQIAANFKVVIADKNEYGVSVEPVAGSGKDYVLSFDRNLLASLTDEELTGAIAHELGHIWIFTHRPYLQTEALANEIALRVVERETLKSVYEKLWKRLGTKGDLAEFLGADPAPAATKIAAHENAAASN